MKYSSTVIDKPEISTEGLFGKVLGNLVKNGLQVYQPDLKEMIGSIKFKLGKTTKKQIDQYCKKEYYKRFSFHFDKNDILIKWSFKHDSNNFIYFSKKLTLDLTYLLGPDRKSYDQKYENSINSTNKQLFTFLKENFGINSDNTTIKQTKTSISDQIGRSTESVTNKSVFTESNTLGTKFSECLKKVVISIIKNIGNSIKEEIKNFSKELTKEILIDKITKFVMSDEFNLRKFFKTQYKDYVDTVKDVYSGFKAQNFNIVKNPEFVLLTEEEYYVLCLSKLPKLIANAETKSVIKPGYMDIPIYLVSTQDKAKIEKLSTFWKDYGTKNNVVKVVNHKGNEFKVFIYGNIEISANVLKETREQLRFTLRYLINKVN